MTSSSTAAPRFARCPSALVTVAATAAAATCASLAEAGTAVDTPRHPVIAIESVTVVDVANGEIAQPRTVVVADGIITDIADPDSVSVPSAAVRVSGEGRYLIPGLVDMHVHLFNNWSRRPPNEWAFPLFVANGVTGVREMSAEPAQIAIVNAWRAKVDRGELVAPLVLVAGVPVGRGSPESSRDQVREAHAAGADFVKVFSDVGATQWRALLDAARSLDSAVHGHVPAGVSLLEAAKTGQRSNEHLTQAYEACSSREKDFIAPRAGLAGGQLVQLRDTQERDVLGAFDRVACDRVADQLAGTGQAQVPTLVLPFFEAHGSPAPYRDDPRWQYLRVDEQQRWQRILDGRADADDEGLSALRLDISRRIVGAFRAAGVRILAGTDAPMPLVYPGFALHDELELLVESGLSPTDALRAATVWPAEFLGRSEHSGSVAAGMRADLVLLDENPLADIRHVRRIRAVVLNGRLLQRADLDAFLHH